MEPHRGSKAKWKSSVRQISICGLLLSALLVSFVELSCASPADVTVTIDTGTTVVTNAFQVGFTLDGQSASYWRGSATAQRYSATNNYAMMRIFDHRLGNPCTYWDEDTKTGRWDWSEYDDLIDDLVALDIEPMICLGYYSNYGSYDALTSTPRGMTRNYAGTYLPDPAQYVEYAKDWVAHFKGRVPYWEIVNEPHIYYGWGGSNRARLRYFTEFFNTVFRGMKSVDSTIKIGNDNAMIASNDHTEYWANNMETLDFMSWHPYLSDGTSSSDSYLMEHAQYDEGGTYGGNNFINPARQTYYNIKGVWLEVICGEKNLSWAWNPTDPRCTQVLSAVCEALRYRTYILNGYVTYALHWEFAAESSHHLRLVRRDTNHREYPYWLDNLMFSDARGTLSVGDTIFLTSSSMSDVVSLGWTHDTWNNILLIHKLKTAVTSVALSGVSGIWEKWTLDHNQESIVPSTQDVTSEFDLDGYGVTLLRQQIDDVTPEIPDETPSFSHIGYNTTIAGNPVEFSASWTDDNGLSGFIFGTNNTGTWKNETWKSLSGTQDWANVSTTLNSTVGVAVQFMWWCNDTANQWIASSIQTLTTASENTPYSIDAGTSTNIANSSCVFSVSWTDTEGLSGFVFGANITGSWTNDTWVDPWAGNPTSGVCDITKNLTSPVGAKVEWRVWCNDTDDNWGQAGELFVVAEQEYTMNLLFFDFYEDFLYNAFLEDSSFPFLEESNGTITELDYDDAEGYFHLKIKSESASYTYLNTNGKGPPYRVTGVANHSYDAILDRSTLIVPLGNETEVGVLWRVQPSLYAHNTTWILNSPKVGGAHTEITLGRFFLFERVTLQNQSFMAVVNGSEYWLCLVDGSNVKLTLHNWFDNFGAAFTVNGACTLVLFVDDKGPPSKVIGANYEWFSGNDTLRMTTTGAGYVGVHWNTGATVMLRNPDQAGFYSSPNNPQGLGAVYGFGITNAGQNAYAFQTTVYCQNGVEDINAVALELGDNITYTYDCATNTVTWADPYNYTEIAAELYTPNQTESAVNYDSRMQYLDVEFLIRFRQISENDSQSDYQFPRYQPYLTNQHANVTVNSKREGFISNEMPAVFYVDAVLPPSLGPIIVPLDLCSMMIGLGGILCIFFAIARRTLESVQLVCSRFFKAIKSLLSRMPSRFRSACLFVVRKFLRNPWRNETVVHTRVFVL